MTLIIDGQFQEIILAKDIVGKSLNVFLHDFKEVAEYKTVLDNVGVDPVHKSWETTGMPAMMKSSENVNDDISADVQIGGHYGAFRASLSAHYDKQVEQSFTHEFCLFEDRAWAWAYQLNKEAALDTELAEEIESLKHGDISVLDFFNKWGTHYVQISAVGGWFRLWFSVDTVVYKSSTTTKAKVNASVKTFTGNLSTSGSVDTNTKKVLNDSQIQGKIVGFSDEICPADSADVAHFMTSGSMQPDVLKALKTWKANWKNSEGLTRVALLELWKLPCLTSDQVTTLRKKYAEYVNGLQRMVVEVQSLATGGCHVTLGNHQQIYSQAGPGYAYIMVQPSYDGLIINGGETKQDGWKTLNAHDPGPGGYALMATGNWDARYGPDWGFFERYVVDHHNIKNWAARKKGDALCYSLFGHAAGGAVDHLGIDAMRSRHKDADTRLSGFLVLRSANNDYDFIVTEKHFGAPETDE